MVGLWGKGAVVAMCSGSCRSSRFVVVLLVTGDLHQGMTGDTKATALYT